MNLKKALPKYQELSAIEEKDDELLESHRKSFLGNND